MTESTISLPNRNEALAHGQARRRARDTEAAAADRTARFGPVVLRRCFIIARITAEARHVTGANAVTLHLIRDGHQVIAPQPFNAPIDAILASIDIVAHIQRGGLP